MDDPYLPPPLPPLPEGKPQKPLKRGLLCAKCGSWNTTDDSVLRRRPSITLAIFFGSLFILIRTALHRRSELCLDCLAIQRYRTVGANIAAVFLVLLNLPLILWVLLKVMS